MDKKEIQNGQIEFYCSNILKLNVPNDSEFPYTKLVNDLTEKIKIINNIFHFNLPIEINLFNDYDLYNCITNSNAPLKRDNNIIYTYFNRNSFEKKYNNFLSNIIMNYMYYLFSINYKDIPEYIKDGCCNYYSNKINFEKESFSSWYIENIIRRDLSIIELDKLNEDIPNYTELSFLLIKYLIDNKTNIDDILTNKLKNNILYDIISYYNNELNVENIKSNFYEISNPNELLDFMSKNILYGWLDKNNNEHIDNLQNVRELYRTSSIEEILEHRIGTCAEQSKLEAYFFSLKNIEYKIFAHRVYEESDNSNERISMHCFVAYNLNNKWYHFEHSSSFQRGIHEYDSLDDLLEDFLDNNHSLDKRVLTEISDIPDGLSFQELNSYINSFDSKKSLR